MGCVCCCRNMCPASTWFATTTSTVTPSGRNSCHVEERNSLVLTAAQASLHVPPAAPEAHSHGQKSPGTLVFHSQRLFGPGAESYSLLLHAVLKEIRLGAGPILYTKGLLAQSSCKIYLPKRSASRGRSGTGQVMLRYQHSATCTDSLPVGVFKHQDSLHKDCPRFVAEASFSK